MCPALGESGTPVADAMAVFLGNGGRLLVTIGTLISIGGLNIAGSFNTPRCGQSMADGGLLPEVLSKKNSRGVPHVAILITGVVTVLLTLTGTFSELAVISVISRFSQYIPTCLAVIALRKKGELKAEYRVPLGLFFPVLGTVTSIWLLANSNLRNLVLGLGAMVLIAPIYLVMKKSANKTA